MVRTLDNMFTSFAAKIVANVMGQTVLIYGSVSVLNAKAGLKLFVSRNAEPDQSKFGDFSRYLVPKRRPVDYLANSLLSIVDTFSTKW